MTRRILSIPAVLILFLVLVAHAATILTVQDNSKEDLGDVTLTGATCGQTVEMSGLAIYTVSAECQLSSITINGQTIEYPNAGTATLQNGARVAVTWSSTSLVAVNDEDIQTRPAP